MTRTLKYIRKAVAGVLFAVAVPFALITAGFYWLIQLIDDAD